MADTGKNIGTGAASGAAVGTAISPGLGSAIGAGVGAIGGLVGSAIQARKERKAREKEVKRLEQREDSEVRRGTADALSAGIDPRINGNAPQAGSDSVAPQSFPDYGSNLSNGMSTGAGIGAGIEELNQNAELRNFQTTLDGRRYAFSMVESQAKRFDADRSENIKSLETIIGQRGIKSSTNKNYSRNTHYAYSSERSKVNNMLKSIKVDEGTATELEKVIGILSENTSKEAKEAKIKASFDWGKNFSLDGEFSQSFEQILRNINDSKHGNKKSESTAKTLDSNKALQYTNQLSGQLLREAAESNGETFEGLDYVTLESYNNMSDFYVDNIIRCNDWLNRYDNDYTNLLNETMSSYGYSKDNIFKNSFPLGRSNRGVQQLYNLKQSYSPNALNQYDGQEFVNKFYQTFGINFPFAPDSQEFNDFFNSLQNPQEEQPQTHYRLGDGWQKDYVLPEGSHTPEDMERREQDFRRNYHMAAGEVRKLRNKYMRAKADYESYRKHGRNGNFSKVELDLLKKKMETAKAGLEAAEARKNNSSPHFINHKKF